MTEKYEYAGFMFAIYKNALGTIDMVAEPGQHSAAYKEKHRMVALSCYMQDQAKVKR